MKEGVTTANEWIQSMGFGAGMGLPNIKRVADEFAIESISIRPIPVVSLDISHDTM